MPAATRTLNDPFGSSNTGVVVFLVRLTIVTVSCVPAVPWVAVIVVKPSDPGIEAVMLPAGGCGGGAASKLVKVEVTAAAR